MTDNTLHSAYSPAPRAHLLSDLVKGNLAPAPIWKKADYRLKFLLRTMIFYRSTRMMLDNLGQRPDFMRLLNAQVTLPSKTHRQYLSRGLSSTQRAQAIVGHYQFVDSMKSPRLASALLATEPTALMTLIGKDDAHLTLYASCARKAEREGESTLWFCTADNVVLASATFSVNRNQDGWEIVIGGLQGPRRSVSHEVIKHATRACYGLFPKRILVAFFGLMAAECGVTSLSGVSDNGHVFRALRYRFSKGRHFHASYDEFWASIDGVKTSEFRWQLPLQQDRKSIEEIASKKRAEYRRRFALLDEMAVQFRSLFPNA
ncbi:VirK/YbjX family protein [Scandinavium sp. M-37]|uniref:VirK/YbjX family protein n=1 Tax=Scandinavium sp. M-37 TaxID=3373077 RepID=UPI0037465F06